MPSWTHPICLACYAQKEPGCSPVRLHREFADEERCCFCGQPTTDGIYYRADPRAVPFPAGAKEE
jgi:hypothetical protein